MIGIIGAMEIEIEGIRNILTEKTEKNISGIKFVSGRLGKNEVVTAVCGIGKVFASMCATSMVLEYTPDVIINTGVAGGLAEGLKIGDIVVADKVVQHDMDTSPIGDPKGLLSGINVIYIPTDKAISDLLLQCVKAEGINAVTGIIATGDQFIASSEKKRFIVDEFSASAAEMEGGAIGQVCYVNKMPFAILRAMSDTADENATVDYPTFAKDIAEKYIRVINRFAELYA